MTARPSARTSSNGLVVFSVCWAAANLFHVWGTSRRSAQLFSHATTAGGLHALLGVAAVAVLVRPRRIEALTVLAILGPITLWFEAPFLGSHWVVVSFVDVGFLLCLVASRSRRRLDGIFFPLARWVLIGFYSFAAFAKLNHGFFTPRVSCGTFYLDELAGSLGITLHSQAGGWWTHLVPFGVAGIELSVPILLLTRRTRHVGVVLGLLFHGTIAYDQTHLFADFSSVLAALFLLFMAPAFFDDVIESWGRLTRTVREWARAGVVLGCSFLLLALWYGKGDVLERLFDDGIGWAWVVYELTGLGLVGWFLWRRRPAALATPMSFRTHGVPRWLAIVPALVVLNGLSPYLELRTAYAFNMYSNLQTVDGRSNHLIVTRTLPLTDFQSDLVQIVSSNDPNLFAYATQQFELPFIELRDYLSHHQSASLTYERNGARHTVARASDDPALVEPVPSWEAKLFAFRSIDETSPARCQPSFLSAL